MMLKMFGIDTIFYTIILQSLLVIIVIMLNMSIERKIYSTIQTTGLDGMNLRKDNLLLYGASSYLSTFSMVANSLMIVCLSSSV